MGNGKLCIYLTFDKQDIVDRYIGYMLSELRQCVDRVVVVCNSLKISKGIEIIKQQADEIYFRKNIGIDIGGFKDALCNLIGWDEVLQYDELILANDSFFGPFRSMRDIFYMMDQRRCDFWGLIMHAECGGGDKIYCPEHIQSFFTVIRSKMLHSTEFREYWEDMTYFRTFAEAVREHEMKFTQYFHDLGYTYDCLAEVGINNSNNIFNNYVQYMAIPYELVKQRDFPFFKKQLLACNQLDIQTQENPKLALDYIEKNTQYDVGMIWENIIRTMDMSDLYRNLHLHYIVSEEAVADRVVNTQIIVAVEVAHLEATEYVLEYLNPLKYFFCIRIYSDDVNVLGVYRMLGYSCKDSALYDKTSLLELSGYEYVCLLHDVDVTGANNPSCMGKSLLYHIFRNLVGSFEYVREVLRLFADNKRLGLIAPVNPVFGHYFAGQRKRWEKAAYRRAVDFINRTGLRCCISEEKAPIFVSNCLWIRGKILKFFSAIENVNTDNLQYIWEYIAQGMGYYSGTVESTDSAAMNEINLAEYIGQMNDQIRRQYGEFGNFLELKKLIMQGALGRFCSAHKEIYIYGTGAVARKYRDIIPGFTAYVVSDGQPKKDMIDGKYVVYLSELNHKQDIGLVVCLDEKNQMQVTAILDNCGWKQKYICV